MRVCAKRLLLVLGRAGQVTPRGRAMSCLRPPAARLPGAALREHKAAMSALGLPTRVRRRLAVAQPWLAPPCHALPLVAMTLPRAPGGLGHAWRAPGPPGACGVNFRRRG